MELIDISGIENMRFQYSHFPTEMIPIVIIALSCSCLIQMGKIHACRECGKGYTQANDLSRHRFDKHHPRLCQWCDYQSSRVYLIRQHVQQHHPSVTLDRENNKVWRFPEDSVEVLPRQPQLPPRMPLRDTTNLQQVDAYVTVPSDNRRVVASTSQSDRRSVIAYSPGPAVNPMLTYVPGNKVMVLSPLHPNPDALQDATPTRTSPTNILPLSPALSEWRDGGDDYTIEEVFLFWMGPMQTKQVSALQKGPWRHLTWMWCDWLVLVLQPLDLMMALWKLVILWSPAQESQVLQMGRHFLVLRLNLPAQLGKNLESVSAVYWDSTRSVATHTQQRCRRRLTTMSDFWPSINVGPTQRSAPPLHHHPVQCRWCCRLVLHSLQTPQQLTCH